MTPTSIMNKYRKEVLIKKRRMETIEDLFKFIQGNVDGDNNLMDGRN